MRFMKKQIIAICSNLVFYTYDIISCILLGISEAGSGRSGGSKRQTCNEWDK